MNNPIYIHYGSDKFDRSRFKTFNSLNPIKLRGINKPDHGIGIWACRIDTDLGWKDWCDAGDIHIERLNESFKFALDKSAKILTVRSNADIDRFTKPYGEMFLFEKVIDFNAIINAGYDGLELIHGDRWKELHYGLFYSWDVDSIVIWNPNVIVEVND